MDDWNPYMPTWERLLIWGFFAWISIGVLVMVRDRPDPIEHPVPPTVITGVQNG